MISEKAVQSFLNRKLDSFEWAKSLVSTQLDGALSELGFSGDIVGKLWNHQKASILIMHHHHRFILHVGMGGGKTRIIISLIRQRKFNNEKVRAIVFVPYVSAVATWVDEISIFAPELACIPLTKSSKQNAENLRTDGDIFVLCYASAIHIPANAFVGFDTFILDEAHKIKNHNTKIFKLCKYISQQASYVYGLTGTPFGKDLQDLWAEFYIIDFGETLGPNISFFRNVFFKYKPKFYGGGEYIPIKNRIKYLKRMIKHKSLHYSVNELSDIPEKQYIKLRIPLAEAIECHVKKAHKELREAIINQDTKLAGNSFLTLRQLSSGFLTFKENIDEQAEERKAERFKIRFNQNPKLDTLIELIEEMPKDCKMVVFHDYIETGQIISERLRAIRMDHARIFGGSKDKLGQLARFTSNASCNILLLNSKSGSSALNLQAANYLVFFECPSVVDRAQAEARCYRPGQRKTVFIYDLFVSGTIDEQHYEAVKNGADLLKDFLSGKNKL